jgi:iron-sulfur cluster assembly protein
MMITLTEQAAKRVQTQLEKRGRGIGIMIGTTRTGCSGLAYKLEYLDEQPQVGEWMSYKSNGVLVCVNQQDLPYVDGLTMAWKRQGLQEGFDFINPQEKARCGCGESFTV